MRARRPSVDTSPGAHAYSGRLERIVEISDANGQGLGALMSVIFRDADPANGGRPTLAVHLYRQDPDVLITVDGCDVVPRVTA